MSVLIDMDMPKVCNECPFCCNPSYFAYAWCELLQQHFDMDESYNKVADFCPITEVPTPHGRLGDLDELEKQFKRAIGTYLPKDPTRHMSVVDASECRGWTQALTAVLEAKTVIKAED